MSFLSLPPTVINWKDADDEERQEYLNRLTDYLLDIYSNIGKQINIGSTKIEVGTGVPTGGNDGDVFVRVAGASTALYLNINGTYSAFTNP